MDNFFHRRTEPRFQHVERSMPVAAEDWDEELTNDSMKYFNFVKFNKNFHFFVENHRQTSTIELEIILCIEMMFLE